jgi:hypothetical protein
MNSGSALIVPGRLRFAALARLGQCNANGLLDRFFFVDGWLAPINPSFFQSSTSVLIFAADDRVVGSFF